jgi:ABC-type glycerol-3-phosphate transport system permease component
VILHVVLVAGLLAMVGPFLWMLLSSFKSEGEVREVPPTWWPHHPTLDNYRDLFARLDFPHYFANSALVAIAVTAGNLLICSATAYALAKLPFPGRRWVFAVVVGNVMVPVMVTFVPTFVLVSRLGLVNTCRADPAQSRDGGQRLPDPPVLLSVPDEMLSPPAWTAPESSASSGRSSCPCAGGLATVGI